MKYERHYKKYKQLQCLVLTFVLLWGILPAEAAFAVEAETVEETETEAITYTTYTNSISGMLWVDMYEDTANGVCSGDGIRQTEEPALSGYTVNLYKAEDKDNAVADTTTGADGKYEFADIEPGEYVVGVVTAAVDKTEYLLPFRMTDDNKFAMAYDVEAGAYVYAYTEPIGIDADSFVSGIDGAMRTSPEIQTRATNSFTVSCKEYPGTTYSVSNWTEVTNIVNGWYWVDWVNGANVFAFPNGTDFTITVNTYDAATVTGLLNDYQGGKKLTLKSADTNSPITISATAGTSGYDPYAFIALWNGTTLTLQDIIIDGGGSSGLYQVCVGMNGGVLNLESGAKIINFKNLDNGNGAIAVNDTTVNIKPGSEISGNESLGSGGGISAEDSTITMTGGTISSNKATTGGGVQLMNSTLTMNGGIISGNTADSGGGVNAIASSTINIDTGTISGNNATTKSGGGIQIEDGDLTMTGGTISGNKATTGSGVQLMSSVFTMSGGIISGNIADSGGGVNAIASSTINIDTGIISGNNATTKSGGGIQIEDGDLTMTGGTISGNKATSGGGVQLMNSTFNMNGGTIEMNQADDGAGVNVTSSSDFFMNGDTTIKSNIASTSGGGVFVGDGCTFEMTAAGACITGNSATESGGGVYVLYQTYNTIFSMTAGVINGNDAVGTLDNSHGGGIAFYVGGIHGNESNLNIALTGGTITGNRATTGGGIGFVNHTNTAVQFTIAGTTIGGLSSDDANTAEEYDYGTYNGGQGGGVGTTTPIGGGTIDLEITEKSDITYNVADINGGGVYCSPDTSLTLTGTTISYNEARRGSGGGVYFHTTESNAGVFFMEAGEIQYNTSTDKGGGLYIGAHSVTTICPATIKNSTISNNTAANRGGGICFQEGSGQLDISGTTIRNNSVPAGSWGEHYGGGIYVLGPASLYIRDTTIANNYAKNGGGGIFTTTEDGLNVPGYYENLDIDDTVSFADNSALNSYKPPTAATIKEFFSTVTDATTTTSTGHKHALNHYDINRVLYEVRIIHLGPDYQVFNEILNTSTMIPNGNEFPTHTPALISGYVYKKWIVSTAASNSGWQTTDVNLAYVFEDADILLYYEGLGSITIKKTDPDGKELKGATFMLEKWDTDAGEWLAYGEGTTGTIEDADGTFVFSDLELGRYRVTETMVPEGFSLLAKSFEVEIPYSETYDSLNQAAEGYLYYSEVKKDDEETINYTCYYYDLTYTVINQPAFTLPAAGSEGFLSQYYLWIGLVFLLAAGGTHVYRRRRRQSCRRQL